MDKTNRQNITKSPIIDELQESYAVCFIATSIAVASALRVVLESFHSNIPYRAVLLLIGCLIGIWSQYDPFLKIFADISNSSPNQILIVFLPILVFNRALGIDSHIFTRSFLQILIISVPGFLITSFFTGAVMMLVLNLKQWSWSACIMFGAMCSPTYPLEIVKLLKEIGPACKYTAVLLEGEGMLSDGTAMIIFYIALAVETNVIVNVFQIILVFLRFTLGGLLWGLIVGKISSFLMGCMYNDAIMEITITVCVNYLTYFLAEEVLFVSGVISLVVVGIFVTAERTSVRSDVEGFLIHFWDILAYYANTMIFIMVGVVLTQQLANFIIAQDIIFVFVTYFISYISRFLMLMVLAPILSRMAYGLTWRHVCVITWGGVRGSISLCLALLALREPLLNDLNSLIVIHATGLVALSLIINVPLAPCLLRILGLADISNTRILAMTCCLKRISDKRFRCISTLKMNRFLADANWPLVEEATRLRHPYNKSYNENDSETEELLDDFLYLGAKYVECPECQRNIPTKPTKKELKEMEREAKIRILKTRKISYGRQYEHGMISRDAVRMLSHAADFAIDTESLDIQLEGMYDMYKSKNSCMNRVRNWLQTICAKTVTEKIYNIPRLRYRRFCFRIIKHQIFKRVVDLIVALSFATVILELACSPAPQTNFEQFIMFASLDLIFFLCFIAEFILKILGYSFVSVCRDGIPTYFHSHWNKLHFIILLVCGTDVVVDWMWFANVGDMSLISTYVTSARCLLLLRLARLMTMFQKCLPFIFRWFDYKINGRLAYGYCLGKGFMTGEEDVLKLLDQNMIDNDNIKIKMRKNIESTRLKITRELGLIQKDKPWIAITVKTRQAIRSTLNGMKDCLLELKEEGFLDEIEFSKIEDILEEKVKYLNTRISSVQPSSPKVIFREVPWMAGDESIINFLYSNAYIKVFDSGDFVAREGSHSDGIYIIISGLLKLTYIPNVAIIRNQTELGILPVVDLTTTTHFEEPFEDYIVSGNSIGELHVLTGRPYDCTLVAETPSQMFVIANDILKQAMTRSDDLVRGLEARIWKFISVRIAATILMDTPQYQSYTQDRINFHLETAHVPTLTEFKLFTVNDLMEDVVLIQGLALDYNSRDLYAAPCYIPRTVQKLILPKSSLFSIKTPINTKLLVIPASDVEDFDITYGTDDSPEMQISVNSGRCLYHLAASKICNSKMQLGMRRVRNMYRGTKRKYGYHRFDNANQINISGNTLPNKENTATHPQIKPVSDLSRSSEIGVRDLTDEAIAEEIENSPSQSKSMLYPSNVKKK